MSTHLPARTGHATERRRAAKRQWLLVAGLIAGLLLWWCGRGSDTPMPTQPTTAAPAQQQPPIHNRSDLLDFSVARSPAAAAVIELVDVVPVPRGRSRALLRVNGGPPQSYGWGDVVSVGVRLARIAPNGIELQRGTLSELLPLSGAALEHATPMETAQSVVSAQDADTSSVIARPADQVPPTSTAIERAIQRSTVR